MRLKLPWLHLRCTWYGSRPRYVVGIEIPRRWGPPVWNFIFKLRLGQ